MRIGKGKHIYKWVGDWANIPDTESAREGWAHHGMAISEGGDIITFHQGDGTVLVLDREGNLKQSWSSGLTEGHGMTLVKEKDDEYLWIADNGAKRNPKSSYDYGEGPRAGRVVKMAMGGQILMELEKPDLPIYRQGEYSPTWVAINEERHGGNGDIWVTDGYGQSHVHRYDKNGRYIASINGEEGTAGTFSCPHAIFIDIRKAEPELYVADRSNARVQVYDVNGNFKRVFGSDFLTSPSGFATHGDLMVIAELRARLTIVDINDKPISHLGDNEAVCETEGWPNNQNENGEIVPTKLLETGKFNSPHGMTVDNDGNVYVAEWLIGGRFTKLSKM